MIVCRWDLLIVKVQELLVPMRVQMASQAVQFFSRTSPMEVEPCRETVDDFAHPSLITTRRKLFTRVRFAPNHGFPREMKCFLIRNVGSSTLSFGKGPETSRFRVRCSVFWAESPGFSWCWTDHTRSRRERDPGLRTRVIEVEAGIFGPHLRPFPAVAQSTAGHVDCSVA